MHKEQSPLAGQTVKIKAATNELGGQDYRVEDWWDRVYGKSWMVAEGNPAALNYALRSAFSNEPIPIDNEVLYGKIGRLGYLVHMNEIETAEEEQPCSDDERSKEINEQSGIHA